MTGKLKLIFSGGIVVFMLFLLGVNSSLNAQTNRNAELGILLGASNYMGDLSHNNVYMDETHPAVGGLLRLNKNNFITFRIHALFATITGSDDNDPNNTPDEDVTILDFQNNDRPEGMKWRRNLMFKNDIVELGGQLELNLTGYNNYHLKFAPFVFAGINAIYHSPRALKDGEWVALQPIGTEGQGILESDLPEPPENFEERNKYSRIQVSFPMGLGIKYGPTEMFNFGLELGYRFTLTDYLDDVSTTYVDPNALITVNGVQSAAFSNRTAEVAPERSQVITYTDGDPRGNRNNWDAYFIGGLTFTFNIDSEAFKSKRSRGRYGVGCPRIERPGRSRIKIKDAWKVNKNLKKDL